MKPVQVEVFVPLPEAGALCSPCELMLRDALEKPGSQACSPDDFPPDWQAALEHLAALVLDLRSRYGSRISIRLVDPRSLPGLIGAFRYRVRRYPTVVIAGRQKVSSLDRRCVEQALRAAGLAEAG